MSRTYSKALIENLNTTKALEFNQDMQGSLQEFNGKLDANQMPLYGVKAADLEGLDLYASTYVDGGQGPVNRYYITSKEATVHWSYSAGEWEVGWTPIADKYGEDGSYMDVPCGEGYLKGSAIVDIERQTSYYKTPDIENDDFISIEWNISAWYEIGVFVNDVLVARSGKLSAKRFTFDLPFSSYVGNESAVIEVKWRAIEIPPPIGALQYVPPDVTVYNSTLWVRNQRR